VCIARSGASVTEPSCTIKTTEKKIKKKKRWKATARNALFSECDPAWFSFSFYGSALLFLSDANIGNGINWKKIHSPGIKHFLSHAFSLFNRS
jgi:hypothetical protein